MFSSPRLFILGSLLLTAMGSCHRAVNPWRLATATGLPAAKSRPHIESIDDLGSLVVPDSGQISTGRGDGVAIPGETILIRGHGFGRLPTVLVGGIPTTVLGRTQDGGILVRIPSGVEAPCRVVVTTIKGMASYRLAFRRYLLATDAHGRLSLSDVTADAPRPLASPQPGVITTMALHRFGSVAYLLDDGGNLVVLDLASAHGPKISGTLANEAPRFIAASSQSDLLVTVGRGRVVLWDVSHPTSPSQWKVYRLPQGTVVSAADLSPDGKTLAVTTIHGLLLADVTDPMSLRWATKTPRRLTTLAIRGVRILPDNPVGAHGQTIWILAGDDRRTVSLGNHGFQIFSAGLHSAANGDDLPTAEHLKKIEHVTSWTPTTWALTFRTGEVVSGTALRQAPAGLLAYVPAVPTDMLRVPEPYDSPAALQALDGWTAGPSGRLFVLDGTGSIRAKRPAAFLFGLAVSTTGRRLWARGCSLLSRKGKAEKTSVVLQCGLVITNGAGTRPRWYRDTGTEPVTEFDKLTRQHIIVQP